MSRRQGVLESLQARSFHRLLANVRCPHQLQKSTCLLSANGRAEPRRAANVPGQKGPCIAALRQDHYVPLARLQWSVRQPTRIATTAASSRPSDGFGGGLNGGRQPRIEFSPSAVPSLGQPASNSVVEGAERGANRLGGFRPPSWHMSQQPSRTSVMQAPRMPVNRQRPHRHEDGAVARLPCRRQRRRSVPPL